MSIKRHSTEEILNKLRQMDVELAKGQSVAAICKLIGIHEQTYVRYHNTLRPHQGLGNIPIPEHVQCQSTIASSMGIKPPTDPPLAGQIKRQQWLGGLLKHYYRQSA